MDSRPSQPNKCDLVLVAGGQGNRFGSSIPKQFEELNGRPLYLWSLEAFLNWPQLGTAVICVPSDWVASVQESLNPIVEVMNATRETPLVLKIISGGVTRQASAYKGLGVLAELSQNQWVMIHDAARPALSVQLLERLWNAHDEKFDGVIPGVGATETIKSISHEGSNEVVSATLPRQLLRVIQTPQLFKREVIISAHEDFAQNDGAVDDSLLVERAGGKVLVVDGDYDNVKVTFPEDKERVSRWLRIRHPQI